MYTIDTNCGSANQTGFAPQIHPAPQFVPTHARHRQFSLKNTYNEAATEERKLNGQLMKS